MGKFLNVLRNRKKIIEGITNSIIKKDFVEKISAKRMEICMSCPHIDLEGSKCAAPGTQPCCGACGCSLGWKTRSLASQCGDDDNVRWPAVMRPEEEDELNEKYGE